jgi:hypothetical protein
MFDKGRRVLLAAGLATTLIAAAAPAEATITILYYEEGTGWPNVVGAQVFCDDGTPYLSYGYVTNTWDYVSQPGYGPC